MNNQEFGGIKIKEREVVTICGSSRFKDKIDEVNEQLTLSGCVVFSLGVWGGQKKEPLTDEVKNDLDSIHFSKIKASNRIIVVNVGSYIGFSTKREIAYAKSIGVKVEYLAH